MPQDTAHSGCTRNFYSRYYSPGRLGDGASQGAKTRQGICGDEPSPPPQKLKQFADIAYRFFTADSKIKT